MPINAILSLMLTAGLVGACLAADEPTPRFTIETPAESRAGCAVIALDEAGSLQVEQAGTRTRLPALVALRQEGRTLPALLTRSFVSLTNGDRLPLDPDAAATLEEGRLHVWPARALPSLHAKGLSLFAPNVVLVFWSLPEGVDDAERFFARLQEEPRKRDAVYLQNGDRIEGVVTALGAKVGCVILTDGRKVQTPWSKLAGVAWNTDRQARLRTKKPYARAVLEGGARVNFQELRFESKSRRWLGKTQFGVILDLPEAAVLAVDMRQGLAVDLADLAPARYEHQPYLGAVWPLMKDSAASGRPLVVHGSTYEKGLGTHAPCQVSYKLGGKYQRFDAVVGIDDGSRRGRARVAIDVDGKRIDLNEGKELTRQTAPLTIRLDVRNVRTLTLIVELGTFGDVQANVNWANARLIKKEMTATK